MQKNQRKIQTLLLAILLATALLASCVKNNVCPEFPLPNEHVQNVLDELSAQDVEVMVWGNQLHILCKQLGTCEEND